MKKGVKNKVLSLLEKHKDCRDIDGFLAIRWLRLHGIYIIPSAHNIEKLNSLKSVWRWRRKIQNEWKTYQASKKVQAKRGVLEEEYRGWAREQKTKGVMDYD